jgi:hypothetical protein
MDWKASTVLITISRLTLMVIATILKYMRRWTAALTCVTTWVVKFPRVPATARC